MSSSETDPPSDRGPRLRLLARGMFALVIVELAISAAFAIAAGRARSVDGLLQIRSAPGQGTTLVGEIPL